MTRFVKVDGDVAEILHHGGVAYRFAISRHGLTPDQARVVAEKWIDGRFTRASVIEAAKATPNTWKAAAFSSKRDALVWLSRGIQTRMKPEEGVTRCSCGAKYWDDIVCASCGSTWDGRDYTEASA